MTRAEAASQRAVERELAEVRRTPGAKLVEDMSPAERESFANIGRIHRDYEPRRGRTLWPHHQG